MAKPSKAVLDEPAQPVRTTRQTRSASAEPTEPARPASRGGRSTKNTRPATANGSRKRGIRAKASETPDLTTVEEHSDIDQALLDAQLQAQAQAQSREEDQVDEIERRRRISGGNASVISGTTAKTSFSQEEVETMDAEVMIDVLPDLLHTSEDLFRLLVPTGSETNPETWKEIRRSGSKLNKLYHNRLRSIAVHKPNFGSQEYISPKHVLKALLGVRDITNVPMAPWRPDDLVYKTNLTHMLNSVLILCDPSDWTPDHTIALERLHSSFLDAIAGREFSLETLEFFLELSAHVTIARIDTHIESEPHFSPHEIIDAQFFDDEDHSLLHEESLGLANVGQEDREDAIRRIQELVADLKDHFQNNDGTGAIAANGQLRSAYKWEDLKISAIRYAAARADQLNERIGQAGGTEQLVKELTKETERRASEKIAQDLRQSFGKASTARRSFGSKNYLAKLREKEKQMLAASVPATAPVAQMTAETPAQPQAAQVSNTAPQRSLQADAVEIAQASAASHSAQRSSTPGLARPSAASNVVEPGATSGDAQPSAAPSSVQRNGKQKARWTDPQPTATRVSPIPEDSPRPAQREPTRAPVASSSRPPVASSSKLGKRNYDDFEQLSEDEEEEVPNPTQDEGFQTDTRDFSAADERRRQVNFQQPARAQNRAVPRSSAVPPPRASSIPGPSPAKRQRRNPGSSIPDPTPPPGAGVYEDALPQGTQWERQKTLAKMTRIGANIKLPRGRIPWTAEEENHFIKLISEHGEGGISWSMLKAIDKGDDDVLSRRSAEDLRFKARGMKVNMLMSRTGELAPNWEYVVLDKKHIDKLHAHQIPYEQEPLRNRARFEMDD